MGYRAVQCAPCQTWSCLMTSTVEIKWNQRCFEHPSWESHVIKELFDFSGTLWSIATPLLGCDVVTCYNVLQLLNIDRFNRVRYCFVTLCILMYDQEIKSIEYWIVCIIEWKLLHDVAESPWLHCRSFLRTALYRLGLCNRLHVVGLTNQIGFVSLSVQTALQSCRASRHQVPDDSPSHH